MLRVVNDMTVFMGKAPAVLVGEETARPVVVLNADDIEIGVSTGIRLIDLGVLIYVFIFFGCDVVKFHEIAKEIINTFGSFLRTDAAFYNSIVNPFKSECYASMIAAYFRYIVIALFTV